jgi:hypothetical protein
MHSTNLDITAELQHDNVGATVATASAAPKIQSYPLWREKSLVAEEYFVAFSYERGFKL